ncbi:MAG: hypothetical protein RLZZ11_1104 [Cyanobacteriota bacterium]
MSRSPALLQAADQLQSSQAEGPLRQPLRQALHQQGLPAERLGQGLALPIHRLARQPSLEHRWPVEAVVVEGIGDGAAQLPERRVQLLQPAVALALQQPALQRGRGGILEQIGQQLQQRPHQVLGAPGVGPRAGLRLQQLIHELAQLGGGEGKAQVGGDAGAIAQGDLLPQPAAGGPGVDDHLDLLERPRWLQPQLGGQHLGQQFSAVAAVEREQG